MPTRSNLLICKQNTKISCLNLFNEPKKNLTLVQFCVIVYVSSCLIFKNPIISELRYMYKSFDLNPQKNFLNIILKKKRSHFILQKYIYFPLSKFLNNQTKQKKHKQPEITRTLYNNIKKKKKTKRT